jgi:membrane-associated protease RseP (regulator of RpoE activity)
VAEVSGSIGGLAATFDIDTGARTSVGLNSPFVQRHALRARFKPSIEAVTGWGLGGATRGTVARVRELKIGTLGIPDVVVDMSLPRQGVLSHAAPSGNLGSGLLKRFVVTFDYARQRVFLRTRTDVAQRDAYDRAGLWLNRARTGFRVEGVVAGSPAAAAGLLPGDHVVAVDGRPWASLELHALREMLRELPAGTVVGISVVRGEARRDVALTLRNLI